MAIPSLLRDLVILRSGNCCEYCRLSQLGQEATFHVDHVVPVAAKGKTEAENLALACVSCSLHKAAKQVANDPDTGEDVPLFNPRLLLRLLRSRRPMASISSMRFSQSTAV
jgi:5-methylcytosine-specific restriction endonuclease McrA